MDKPASPFLPGTNIQFAWDSTSLSYLKTCPRLYQYTMIEGWVPKDTSVHLRFGIEYHKALEEYDEHKLAKESHEDSVRLVVRDLLCRISDWNPSTDNPAGKYKNPRTLVQLVIDYLDKYTDDPAQTFIRENGQPATELSFKFELDWGPQQGPKSVDEYPVDSAGYVDTNKLPRWQPYLLCGHLDRVVTYAGELMVMDRKTTQTTLSTYYFNQYTPNNQMTLYTLAGKIILDSPIKGVVIDGAQILLEKPNAFARGFTYRTQAQLEEWLADLRFWLHQAENYATLGHWPMNDTACGNYGGCRFRDVCSRDPSVRRRFLEADFIQLPPEDRWNPLKSRGQKNES